MVVFGCPQLACANTALLFSSEAGVTLGIRRKIIVYRNQWNVRKPFVVSMSQNCKDLRLYSLVKNCQVPTSTVWSGYLWKHERMAESGGSQDLCNGTNVASELANFFHCHIYSLCFKLVISPSSRKPRSSPTKNKPSSKDMHLKMPIWSRSMKLSNSKPGCRVSGSQLFTSLWNIGITHDFLTSSSIKFFQLPIAIWTPVSILESKLGLEILTNSRTLKTDHLHICSLWFYYWGRSADRSTHPREPSNRKSWRGLWRVQHVGRPGVDIGADLETEHDVVEAATWSAFLRSFKPGS